MKEGSKLHVSPLWPAFILPDLSFTVTFLVGREPRLFCVSNSRGTPLLAIDRVGLKRFIDGNLLILGVDGIELGSLGKGSQR